MALDVVARPRLLVSGGGWYWVVFGRDQTRIGHKFFSRHDLADERTLVFLNVSVH
jgi:hypothetical protein